MLSVVILEDEVDRTRENRVMAAIKSGDLKNVTVFEVPPTDTQTAILGHRYTTNSNIELVHAPKVIHGFNGRLEIGPAKEILSLDPAIKSGSYTTVIRTVKYGTKLFPDLQIEENDSVYQDAMNAVQKEVVRLMAQYTDDMFLFGHIPNREERVMSEFSRNPYRFMSDSDYGIDGRYLWEQQDYRSNMNNREKARRWEGTWHDVIDTIKRDKSMGILPYIKLSLD